MNCPTGGSHEEKTQPHPDFQPAHDYPVCHGPGTDRHPAWRRLVVRRPGPERQQSTGPMYFVGTLTERIGCDDNCSYPNNYPWEGFQLLSRALASDTTTRQAMRWSADIEFQPNQP
jgi:hypothetical protein